MKNYTITEQYKEWRNPYGGELDFSSIDTDDKINDTIKPIDRDLSNAEIEKGELVQLKDGTVFKALGKKHSQGGTPVNLPSKSFIYSDHKPLSISKKDSKAFGFKVDGTPAKVITKEIDIKHHNKMLSIMNDENADVLSKNAAEMMLNKNFKRLGQVAYLQEEIKGFPNGLPEHSQNTAPKPVDINKQAMEKQYKNGGFIQLPKYQSAGENEEPYWKRYINNAKKVESSQLPRLGLLEGKNYYGTITPGNKIKSTGYSNATFEDFMDSNSNYKSFREAAKGLPVDMQKDLYNKWQKGYRGNNVNLEYTNNNTGIERESAAPEFVTKLPEGRPITVGTGTPSSFIPLQSLEKENLPILPYEQNIPFSDWQKMNLGVAAYNTASIKKYNPMRSQYNFTPITLEKINDQSSINAIDNSTRMAYDNSRILSTPAATANNSQIRGNALDRRSQATGNIRNQNLQISNAENQYNNQGINNTNARNVQANQQYYDNQNQVNQNYEREVRTGNNKFVSLGNAYKSQNDALELQLASQKMYSRDMYQDENGKIITPEQYDRVQDKSRFRKVRQAAPAMTYDPKKQKVVYTGVDANFENAASGTNPIDSYMDGLFKKAATSGLSNAEMSVISSYLRSRK